MRRFALLGLALLLPGCEYASSPFVSFGGFIGDTHTFYRDSNQPVGNSTNTLRVVGRPVALPPLEPEPGNVWPGPQPPEPTLQDIEQQQNSGAPPAQLQQPSNLPAMTPPPSATPSFPSPTGVPAPPRVQTPRPTPQGSSTPPSPNATVPPPAPVPGPAPSPSTPPNPTSRTYITPQGPVQASPGANGITTYQAPGGGTGIIVPNGNGTSTLIGPDGSVTTVPTPR